ncbi:Coiled-coil domain-containing protein 82 [Branchiostoma belcheri]|nr:Coiled-coil domain-containing protein 82 [Branchiostoma belcheri]
MSCNRTTGTTRKSYQAETPACHRSRSLQGTSQREQRQLRFGDREMTGEGRSVSPRRRKSTRAAKNPRVSYEELGDVSLSDESDGSLWDEMGLSDSDEVSQNNRRKKPKRTVQTRRRMRASSSTKKRFTRGHDAASSSEEESDDFIVDSEVTSSSSSSHDHSDESCPSPQEIKQRKNRLRTNGRARRDADNMKRDSDEDVAVSSSAKKRKKSSAQLVSSSDEEEQQKRRRRIIIASDSSDNSDEGCRKLETSETTSAENGQPNNQQHAGVKDAAAMSEGAGGGVRSDKGRSEKDGRDRDKRNGTSSSKTRRARTSAIQDKKQTALERLKRQRDRKKQDSFIVSDETDEEDGDEILEDEDSVGEIVHQEKKTQFQSWLELMLCANLQDNPGEYLRTARFNRDIPDDTRNNVAEVLHRIQAATSLVFSTAWRKSFKEAIEMHPFYVNNPSHSYMNCQACGRPDHPSSQAISLRGTPYDRETFEDDDFGNYEKSFHVGCFCQERSELYHGLYHFRYRVFHTCKAEAEKTLAMLRDEGEEDPDDDKVIDRCLKDQDWTDELFNEMEGLIEDVHQQYTADYSKPWKAV